MSDVVNALRTQNTTAPVGKGARAAGRPEHPAGGAHRAAGRLRAGGGRSGDRLVRLGQVATVEDGFAEPDSLSIRSGKPNVGIAITRTREGSTVSVANDVEEAG